MSTLPTPLPFGLRQVMVYPLTGEQPAASGIRLPNSRTFSFSEAEDFEELRGDDGLVAVVGLGPAVDWELEGGGTPLEAIKALYGGTISESGTSPAKVKTFEKKGTDTRPYVQVRGRAISDSGGDFVVTISKARATGELSGEMADGSFWLTGASGRALPRETDGVVYKFEQRETAEALT
jgi:hypothetical protein